MYIFLVWSFGGELTGVYSTEEYAKVNANDDDEIERTLINKIRVIG